MKRFYCTICKKVKRVRKLPTVLDNVGSISPDARIGECNWHTERSIRAIRKVSKTVSRKRAS